MSGCWHNCRSLIAAFCTTSWRGRRYSCDHFAQAYKSGQSVSSVFTVAWSQDGKRLALGYADGSVQVYNATNGKIDFTARGHSGHVWALAWSPDGKRLASASWDRTVQIWDSSTGSSLLTYR